MSVKMSGTYLGDKKVELTHDQSGTKIISAAPLDNNGDGSSFSPTDLLTISFPSCVLTIMSIAAEQKDFSIAGAHFTVEKHMIAEPRRLGKLKVEFILPESLTDREKAICEGAVTSCPVHGSLHPDIEIDVQFNYSA